MSNFISMMQDISYAHSNEYYEELRGYESGLGIFQGNSPQFAHCAAKYETLLRRYGARTECSYEVLKTLAKQENRDIITTGNLLHLGNCIAEPAEISLSCTEGDDKMSRHKYKVTKPDGTTIWITGNTVSDCFNRYAEMCGGGSLPAPAPSPKETAPLFADYALYWHRTYGQNKKNGRKAEGTIAGEQSNLNTHIIPHFKGKRIDEITTADIQGFYEAMKDYSKSINDQCKTLLNGIFKLAYHGEHLIKENPMDSPFLSVVSTKKKKRESLTRDQMISIQNDLSKLCTEDKTIMGILLYTGVRRGEMLGLRWSDIDFAEKLIHIERQITVFKNRPIVKPPKSEAGIRPIPLVPELEAILRETLPTDPQRMSDYVVSGTEPFSDRQIRNRMERINKSVNLFGATPHVFRHTFVSMAVGHMDVKTMQRIAGHSKISMTLDTYADAMDHRIREQSTNLAGMYSAKSA